MLRLSSLLPIIRIAPILERDPGRLPFSPPVEGKSGPPKDNPDAPAKGIPAEPAEGKQAGPAKGSAAIALRSDSVDPSRDRSEIPAHDRPAQDQARTTAERPANQASQLARSASYSSVSLFNSAFARAEPSPAGQTRFSATATLLASLTPKTAQANVPTQVRSPAPLIPGKPDQPAVLAAALRDAINLSGLFYESHLEQWSNGSLPLETLKQEPQAALPPVLNFNLPESASPTAGQAQPTVAHEPIAWLQQNLVQQLSLLNNPALSWSGQAWPGQFVAVQTSRDPAKPVADEASWVTRLSLEMPHLGKVEVVISLDSRGVELDVQGEAASGLNTLQARQADLGRQLADTGCTLRRIRFRSSHESA